MDNTSNSIPLSLIPRFVGAAFSKNLEEVSKQFRRAKKADLLCNKTESLEVEESRPKGGMEELIE